jgi:hypothetical protein
MDTLVHIFLENLTLLTLTEFFALATVLAVHRSYFTPRTRAAVWITLVVCGLLIGLNLYIETDREKLEQLVEALAEAVDDGDVETLGANIAESFRYEGQTKRFFLEAVYRDLQRFQIDEASVGGFSIELAGDRATVNFRASCDYKSDQRARANIPSQWTVVCVRTPDGWKLQTIEEARVGFANATIDLDDARRY